MAKGNWLNNWLSSAFKSSKGIEGDLKNLRAENERLKRENVEMAAIDGNDIVVSAGRNSDPYGSLSTTEGIISTYDIDFDFEVLKVLETLAIFNESVSKAVENIVSISNTKSKLVLPKTIGAKQAREMQAHWDLVSSCWYENNTGEETLTSDVFAQLAIYGCISTESEIKQDLSGIAMEHRVSPYYIRFRLDKETQRNIPLQLSNKNGGLRDLNTMQYHYYALKRFGESPYAIPPFISALKTIAIQLNMVKNFEVMMEKIGMLGFMQVLIQKPEKNNKESDSAYKNRLRTILTNANTNSKEGFSKGYFVGFEGMHQVSVSGNTINADAAKDLMEIINKMTFEGLKQDPNLFGYNYSTTETYGKVMLRIMSGQAIQYQNEVANWKAKRANLEFLLAGFTPVKDFNGRINPINPFSLSFEFEKPLNFDVKERAETERVIIENAVRKRDEGFATQQQASAEAGYATPAMKNAPKKERLNNEYDKAIKSDVKKVFDYYNRLSTYDYSIPKGCDQQTYVEDFGDDDYLTDAYDGYNDSVTNVFDDFIDESVSGMVEQLNRRGTGDSDSILGSIYVNLFNRLDSDFLDLTKPITKEVVTTVYSNYREDQSIFSHTPKGIEFRDIPDAEFNTLDWRLIDYMERSDNAYLGKFITDEDTQARVKRFIDNYVDDIGNPLDSASEMEAFAKSLSDTLKIEGWKISRIVATTLNKARSYSSIQYMSQAEVTEYEVVEVNDTRTCRYCRHMHGKRFKVLDAVNHIAQIAASDPFDVPNISPFATTIKIDEFEKMTTEELNQANINKAPYHANCRGRNVAVI